MIYTMRTVTGHELPAIHDGAEWRFLGRIKTENRKLQVRPFSEYLQSKGIPPADLTTLAPFDRYQHNVPILDQAQCGSCTAHSHTAAMLKARDLAGMTLELLSADTLYAQIDNDQDQGSDPADAITAISTPNGGGICLLSDVPDNFILWNAVPDSAKQNALRFRISPAAAYRMTTLAELVTADSLGFATTLTVNVGNDFNNLDSDGVVPFAGGQANHCVSGGESFKRLVDGTPAYRFRNSWRTSWGQNGCAWLTEQHINRQPNVELFAIMWVLEDPDDKNGDVPLLS